MAHKGDQADQANETPPRDLITPKEAARLLHCHVNTVRRWLKKGILTPWRLVGRWRVSKAEARRLFKRLQGGAPTAREAMEKEVTSAAEEVSERPPAEPLKLTTRAQIAAAESWVDQELRKVGVRR